MGGKISIDKHVSNLQELLEMSAQYFQKVKFESKISADLTQHLKVCYQVHCRSLEHRFALQARFSGVNELFACLKLPVSNLLLQIWRFSEDNSKFDSVRTSPVPLATLSQNGFSFSRKESYLTLFIYKEGSAGR